MRRILVIFLTICSLSPAWAVDNLQKALDKARIDNKVSAMQMTIILPHQAPRTFTSGTATKAADAPVITHSTLFQIGSETKSFTAALILKLEMDGKLKLTDTLGEYFPQYKQWRQITLSQLLHNNSGIPSYSENKVFQQQIKMKPDNLWTSSELIAIAAKRKDDFAPGQGWHYSNSNFVLAGMIAEKVTNQSLNDLYQHYFLSESALDLKNTYYITDQYKPEFIKRMAHGYDEDNHDITNGNMSWGSAAGAMVSNSHDLAVWAYSLFHGKVLPADIQKQLMSVVSTKTGLPEGKEGYGLGVGTRIDKNFGKWWGHEGETLGYHAIFIWYPEYDITIAILSNGEAPHLRDFAVSLPGVLGIKPRK
jgi:D-alanyl-D-alanine carboxypeptidase